MFKCLVIFTKTMAGLIILATGLRGYNLLMLKANMLKDDTVIQSNVEVIENNEIYVPDNNRTEENNNQNIPNNSTTNEVKEEKKTISNTKTNETKTQNNVSKNNTTIAQTQINTSNINKQNNVQESNSDVQTKTEEIKTEENKTEAQQPQVQKEEQKPVQEVVKQPVREVKRNDEMIQKIKTYISAHETERMKKYGYSFVVDPEVVKITNPFTYSEFNMNSCLNRTGVYRIYAQDYYYNGKYVETQCFVY